MNKCSAAEMRQNLEVVETYKRCGLDFVPIPVRDEAHKLALINQGNEILELILKEREGEQ